jgi:hypothetical protein
LKPAVLLKEEVLERTKYPKTNSFQDKGGGTPTEAPYFKNINK